MILRKTLRRTIDQKKFTGDHASEKVKAIIELNNLRFPRFLRDIKFNTQRILKRLK